MAREEYTVEEMESISAEIAAICEKVKRVCKKMREENHETLLVHGAATMHTYLPYVFEWAAKLESDAEIQTRAFRHGLKSGARYEVTRYKKRSSQKKVRS